MHRFEATTAYQYAAKYRSYSSLTNCFGFLTWARFRLFNISKIMTQIMLHVGWMLDQMSSGKGK